MGNNGQKGMPGDEGTVGMQGPPGPMGPTTVGGKAVLYIYLFTIITLLIWGRDSIELN